MLAKNPLDIPSEKKLSKEEIAQALRLAIMAEYDAINLYLQLAEAIEDEKIKAVFQDVAQEEKVHVGEFMSLLEHLDPEMRESIEEGFDEVKDHTGIDPREK